MVTLTNKTNRHIEIESIDHEVVVINSMETSKPLDEKQFTNRTCRLISESKLLKKVIEEVKPLETEVEVPTEDKKTTKVASKKSK